MASTAQGRGTADQLAQGISLLQSLPAIFAAIAAVIATVKSMLPAKGPKPILLPGAPSQPHPAQEPTLVGGEIDEVIAPPPLRSEITRIVGHLFQTKLQFSRFPDSDPNALQHPTQGGNAINYGSKAWWTHSAFLVNGHELIESERVAAGLVFATGFYVRHTGTGSVASFVGGGWKGEITGEGDQYAYNRNGSPNLIGRPKCTDYAVTETDEVGWGQQAYLATLGANVQGQLHAEGTYETWTTSQGMESAHETWVVS